MPDHLNKAGENLLNTEKSLAERFRSLFMLRNIGGQEAIAFIERCFSDSSALLKHECAYCLGQMQDNRALPVLYKVLSDEKQETIVRHEAGEALGAIGSEEAVTVLEKYRCCGEQDIAETCELALARIKWLSSPSAAKEDLPSNPYKSVDPAPPQKLHQMETLTATYLDEKADLFERYRALFAMRNIGGDDAVTNIAKGLNCSRSALFRHEVAYVLGQMQNSLAISQLSRNLSDIEESPMVRHECAEALGSIATGECHDVLQKFLDDKERVVSESCQVALDMLECEHSGQFVAVPS